MPLRPLRLRCTHAPAYHPQGQSDPVYGGETRMDDQNPPTTFKDQRQCRQLQMSHSKLCSKIKVTTGDKRRSKTQLLSATRCVLAHTPTTLLWPTERRPCAVSCRCRIQSRCVRVLIARLKVKRGRYRATLGAKSKNISSCCIDCSSTSKKNWPILSGQPLIGPFYLKDTRLSI